VNNDIRILKLTIDASMKRLLGLCMQGRLPAADLEPARQLVSEIFPILGGSLISTKVEGRLVEVTWKPGVDGEDPVEKLLPMLEGGRLAEAAFVLQFLLSDDRDNPAILYNLGMAYSDLRILEVAVPILCRLVELQPENSNGMTALAVALMRMDSVEEAESTLRKALGSGSENPWVYRNLGAVLAKQGRFAEALPYLKKATELNPEDERSWLGLGKALEDTGDSHGADEAYRHVLATNEYGETAEIARAARSKIATQTFRAAVPSMERMDAVMYLLGALEKFESMSSAAVKQVGFEVAMLGTGGIDINDPAQKYQLRCLPGNFSGLHLLCLEYASFKKTAPDMDIGFDLSKEYKSALSMMELRSKKH